MEYLFFLILRYLYYFCVLICFLIILIPIAKIYFNNKFSKKAFLVSLSILIITGTVCYGCYLFSDLDIHYTFWENNYMLISDLLYNFCRAFALVIIYFVPVLFTVSFIYFLATKNKEVIKKFILSLLILLPFIYVTYPISVINIKNLNKNHNTDIITHSKQTNKYIADRLVIPCVKAIYTFETTLYLHSLIQFKFYNEKTGTYDLSSDEAKMLVDDIIKYTKYTLEHTHTCPNINDVRLIIKYGRYDDALYLIELGEKDLKKPLISLRVSLYLAQNEYQKALDYINQINIPNKQSYYSIIYAGLKDYDKAYEYSPSRMLKIYLDYKTGKRELAQKEFDEIRKKYYSENWTLDEYILYYENAYIH